MLPADRERIQSRLEELHSRCREPADEGVAKYYASGRGYYLPADAGPERDHFGVAAVTLEGEVFAAGDSQLAFPLQSISKVFAYGLALEDHGRDRVLRRVGVEPSGDAFNSLVLDERNDRPHNPMVNAGALVSTDMVRGRDTDEQLERIVDCLRRFAANESLAADEALFAAEVDTADRNRATAYLMRSDDMLRGDVEVLLALYLRQCSVHVSCRDLAVMGATLANGCVNPLTGERVLSPATARDLLSVMHTCGMYDFAGEWAFQVGFPAKSGVSGGVLAAVPAKMGIGVYSPGLDAYGNSVRGTRVCTEFSERLGLHVFAAEDQDSLLGGVAA